MPKFVKIVSIMFFFCPKIYQHRSCFVDKITRNTTVQMDHKSDTRFRKYDHLKLINPSNQSINVFIHTNHHETRGGCSLTNFWWPNLAPAQSQQIGLEKPGKAKMFGAKLIFGIESNASQITRATSNFGIVCFGAEPNSPQIPGRAFRPPGFRRGIAHEDNGVTKFFWVLLKFWYGSLR